MWEASVIVLSLMYGPQVGADTRGPYETEIECINRTEEMITVIESFTPGIIKIEGHCQQDGQAV